MVDNLVDSKVVNLGDKKDHHLMEVLKERLGRGECNKVKGDSLVVIRVPK